MDEVRDKLVELLAADDCPLLYVLGKDVGSLADYLIANGATIQRWIPVTERLPENEEYVLVCTRSRNGSRNVDKGYCYNGGWAHRGTAKVTHWMPLPQAPGKEGAE